MRIHADPDPGRALRHKELNYKVHEKYSKLDVDYRSINISSQSRYKKACLKGWHSGSTDNFGKFPRSS
jgi:hypothetical protein